MSLPTVTISGNVRKPQTRFTNSGKEVTVFTVECSEKNNKGEWDNLYIKGEVWDKKSQFFNQYFKDGSAIVATGKLVTNVYEKQDGSKVYENKLHFPDISFVPKDKVQQEDRGYSNPNPTYQKPQGQGQINPNQMANYNQQGLEVIDEQIPFAPLGLQYPYMRFAV
jgi:single stranded DNA-binding protein